MNRLLTLDEAARGFLADIKAMAGGAPDLEVAFALALGATLGAPVGKMPKRSRDAFVRWADARK